MASRLETGPTTNVLREGDVIPHHAVTVSVSLDSEPAPMRDGDATEMRKTMAEEARLTRGPAGYREISCGTLSFCDGEGEMLSAVRIARMPEMKSHPSTKGV